MYVVASKRSISSDLGQDVNHSSRVFHQSRSSSHAAYLRRNGRVWICCLIGFQVSGHVANPFVVSFLPLASPSFLPSVSVELRSCKALRRSEWESEGVDRMDAESSSNVRRMLAESSADGRTLGTYRSTVW